MNSDLKPKAENLIIQYFIRLENKIDISTERCLAINSNEKISNVINNSRQNYLQTLNQAKQNILKNLDNSLSKWNGQNSLESVVFNNEYFLFLEPIHENDIGKCIGKLIKFDYYLCEKILDQLQLILDQTRKEGYFILENLDENILHAYLLIREIDPFIDDIEFIQKADNSIWRTDKLHESKLSNIYESQKIELQFFQIKHINSKTFSKMKNLIDLSITNCGLENFDKDVFSGIVYLKTLNLSFNQFYSLEPNLFCSLINLEELIICGCSISFIDQECFRNLPKIKLLDLSKNCLPKVEPGWLKNMQNLEILYLNSNRIEFLEDQTFDSLKNLRYLNISKNRIENIQARVFRDLQNIDEICYDLFYDLKSILGDSFRHVKFHPSQNNVM